jgi:TRAP-type C4-dicarboxylate transport system substrate-binding protein
VCNITKKFEDAKFFTQINYAQGLFIWVINKAWFNTLPPDLQKIFKETAKEIAAKIRQETRQQETDEIEKAKAAGIQFFKLSGEEMKILDKQGDAAHKQYTEEINKLYTGDKYRPTNYLKEVQDFLGYQP